MKTLLIESFFFGLVTMLIGSIMIKIIISFNDVENNESILLADNLKKWNNYYILEISLFFTGILVHLILEYSGFNDWYCEKQCVDDVCEMVCKKKIIE
jgi:uncharacterized membrane protein